MELFDLFVAVLKAAALSVGGLSSLPLLREQLVAGGYVTEPQVIEALAIGRLSTGPSGLYIVSLGYFAAGWAGAAVALAAATLPPLSMVVVAASLRRYLLTPWAAGMVRGVALSTSGLVFAVGIQLALGDRAPLAVPVWQLALTLGAAVLTVQGRVHPALLVGVGAVAGLALAR